MAELEGPAEKARVAANPRVSLLAGLAGSALGAAANLLSGKTRNAVPVIVLGGLCLVALWLLRRARARAAALVLLAAHLGSVHAMLMAGQGVHDRAALLYPVIIPVAAAVIDYFKE